MNIEGLSQVTDVGALLRRVLVSHPWRHLGQILYIEQLEGWRYHLLGQRYGQEVIRAACEAPPPGRRMTSDGVH
jgi:hypothetical protein